MKITEEKNCWNYSERSEQRLETLKNWAETNKLSKEETHVKMTKRGFTNYLLRKEQKLENYRKEQKIA